MRHLCVTVVFIILSLQAVAQVDNRIQEVKKLALIGDEKICALLMVKLSTDNNIELLERAEINRVLKEHKLSEQHLVATQLAKLFPHVDAFAIIHNRRFIMFNAKNGFRLMDANSDNVEHLASFARLAMKKLTTQNPLYLSIVSVRDIGVPRRYKTTIKEFTRRLEQDLMLQPNIQLLERSHLGLVNKERELTKTYYNLQASARLLTLEFEPGSKANIINLKLIIRNLANKTVGRVRQNDSFRDIPRAVRAIVRQLKDKLNIATNGTDSQQAEAIRFFREYQRLVNSQGSGYHNEIEKFQTAKDKLFSALALMPNNRQIRFAELIYYSKIIHTLPLNKKISAMYKQLQRAKKFRRDFGVCRPSVFETEILCGGILTNNASQWTPEFQQQYSQFCREFRPLLIADIKELYYPYELTDGINSLKELQNLTDVIIRSNWDYYYGNQREWLKQRLNDYTLLYKEAAKYITAHPQDIVKVNHIIRECHLTDIFYPNQRSLKLSELVEYLEQTQEICQFVANSKLNSIKPEIFLLDAMRMAIKKMTIENFTVAIDQYFERLATLNAGWLKRRQSPEESNFKNSTQYYRLRIFCDKTIKQYNLPDQRLRVYQQTHSTNSDFETLELWMTERVHSRKPFTYSTNIVNIMKKLCLLNLKNNSLGNRYRAVIESVFYQDRHGKAIVPDKMKFFYKINSNFTITTKPYYKLSTMTGTQSQVKLCGTAKNGDEIALFFDNKYIIIRRPDGSFSSLPKPPTALLNPYNKFSRVFKRPCALSNSHLVFADEKNNLCIYDRIGKKWLFIKDFSPEPIINLLIHCNKLYALAGDLEWAEYNRPNYMFCCNLDGSKRKIIFSSEHSEKLNALEKMRGGLSGLTAIGDNKLAFLLTYTNKYTQIWQYNIKQNSLTRLFKAPYSGTDNDALWQGVDKVLYLSSCSWSERLYRFKPDKYKAEWIFSQHGHKNKFDLPADKPAFFNGIAQLTPPWRVSGNYLWCGGYTSALLNLNNIANNPPLLLLPRTRYLYELGPNKMIFFGDYRYFIVEFNNHKDNTR